MMMMDLPTIDCGPWKKLRILGGGAFGEIALWYNCENGNKLAIKTLNDSVLSDETTRGQKLERWRREVEAMKKINHSNVVAGLPLPIEMINTSRIPVLTMEFCSMGNLRETLRRAEHSCGLKEFDVVNVLKDMSSALSYLHFCKITHKDVKPENIVIEESEYRNTYKLIDLGYVKDFDQNSLATTFEGTIQYIAPELYAGQRGNAAADYWSLGILAHEIMTGFRPFMPGISPTEWMRRVQYKGRDIIRVTEDEDGILSFKSTISRRNHMSRCLIRDMEKWLQLALDWNPQTRGRDAVTNRIVIFDKLDKILSKKVLKVFSFPTYQTLAYEVKLGTEVPDLKRWLKADTGLDEDAQLLLLPNGKMLNPRGRLLSLLASASEVLNRKGVSIFLYRSGEISQLRYENVKPNFIESLLSIPERRVKHRHLKRDYASVIHFVQFESIRYANMLRAIKVKIANIKHNTATIENLFEAVGDAWNRLENYGLFVNLAFKMDVDNYINYRKNGPLENSFLVKKWNGRVSEVNKKIKQLRSSYNITDQRHMVIVARQRCRNLDSHTEYENCQRTPLDDAVIEGFKMWMTVQKVARHQRERLISNSRGWHLIRKCIEEVGKMIQSQAFECIFAKINEADEGLATFLSSLTSMLRNMKQATQFVENTQMERQKDIWKLLEKTKAEAAERNLRGRAASSSSQSRAAGPSSVKGASLRGLPNPEEWDDLADATALIKDSNNLRNMMQEAQKSCRKIVKEMRSFDWEFLKHP